MRSMAYQTWKFWFWDMGCSNVFLLLQPLSLPQFFSFGLAFLLQCSSNGCFLRGFIGMSPNPVLLQALQAWVHLGIYFTTAVSMIAAETCCWGRIHVVGRVWEA